MTTTPYHRCLTGFSLCHATQGVPKPLPNHTRIRIWQAMKKAETKLRQTQQPQEINP